jgi:hypothetical protein
MRYVLCPAFAAAILLSCGQTLSAGESAFEQGYHSMKRDFLRNNYWPQPFLYPDRDALCAPFAVMVHNGWRMQNTLSAHHFKPGTGDLTESGQLKLNWVMSEVPPQYRTVYVERGETVEVTAKRIRAVEMAAGRLTVDGNVPPVMETAIAARGWPADQIDATTRQWLNSVPQPRLPSSGGGGGEGGK